MPQPPPPSAELSKPGAPIGVLVIDDQAAVREGLARLIACAPLALRYVSTAATRADALKAVHQLQPDVVVLDVDLAGEDGLALIPQFALTSNILVLTSHGDPTTRARAAQLGAHAFIEKHQPAAELLQAIADICHRKNQGREKAPNGEGTSPPPAMAPSSDAIKPTGA